MFCITELLWKYAVYNFFFHFSLLINAVEWPFHFSPVFCLQVVTNIHAIVGNKYYGMKLAQVQIHRRAGHPKGQHDPSLCYACEMGICRRNSPNPNI